MSKLSLHGSTTLWETEELLLREIPKCGITCELKDRVSHNRDGQRLTVMVFEKYYMRVGNYASLTVVVSGRDGDVSVDLISAGARSGVVSFSWGAEDKFVRTVAELLQKHGFQ